MAGNSSRRGAVRKSSSKGRKGPNKGSGGENKKRLQGRGPTPKAEDRPYHAKAKAKAAGRPYPNLVDNMNAAKKKKKNNVLSTNAGKSLRP